jgi:hypothetical protein
MQKPLKQIITESRILKAVIVFLVSYIILSVVWLQIKDVYGYGIAFVASKFIAELKDARIEEITKGSNLITSTFSSIKSGNPILIDVQVQTFAFAFNVPMIISMLASLYPFLKRRKRAYAEALLILLLIHILYVFSLGMVQLTNTFMIRGIEAESVLRLFIYEFLWAVTSCASVSFAPFLIVIYTFVRFRK